MSAECWRAWPQAGVAIAVLSTANAACSRTNDTPLPLAKVADVPLTGGATRWDYASFDPPRQHRSSPTSVMAW